MKYAHHTIKLDPSEFPTEKECLHCHIVKPREEYNPAPRAKDNKALWCKTCDIELKENHSFGYLKNYRLRLSVTVDHDRKMKNQRMRHAEYYKANPKGSWDRMNRYLTKKYKEDPLYREEVAERIHLMNAINFKGSGNSKYLGCTPQKLRDHLESQFTEGMTWKNRGRKGWHIDHIRPKASFDLTKESEKKLCHHYTNLQPMWASENMSKGAWYNGVNYKKSEPML